jgi:hypothetical protein
MDGLILRWMVMLLRYGFAPEAVGRPNPLG